MQLKSLHPKYDQLQLVHGDSEYQAIYGAGSTTTPDICLVFMNPTARNISSERNWQGIRAPWIGTKKVWQMLASLELFDPELAQVIQRQKPQNWSEEFSHQVYSHIQAKGIFITNLAKCTQTDARPLPNSVFREYLPLMHQEIQALNPKVIITFGNQVSSILLQQPISVSRTRKQVFKLEIRDDSYKVFPVYYPVGQGQRNMPLAKEDISWIRKNFL